MSAKDLLDLIRERQGISVLNPKTPEEKERYKLEQSMKRAPVSQDDWQEFKRKFVEEYGDEKVQLDGMTHSEFIQYLKDGTREGADPYSDSEKLRDFLRRL